MSAPTIKKSTVIGDVAMAAGVSVATVSRVITGAARVSLEKRARVQTAIEELGFRPSSTARALVHGHAQMIAVVSGDTSKYGYATTIRGVEEAARAAGFVVLIIVLESVEETVVQAALDLLLTQPVAGVVVLKFDEAGEYAIRRLPPTATVVAISGERELRVPQAQLDEQEAGYTITEYLISLGHTTVHHVTIPGGSHEAGRTSGWRNALRDHGIDPPDLLAATWEPESGRAIGRILATRSDVTAIFCGNDEIAMGAMRGIADVGKSVPGDISVVGFDNHPLSSLWAPALTTVDQDFANLGRRAFHLLIERLHGNHGAQLSTEQPTLVIRESAAPPGR